MTTIVEMCVHMDCTCVGCEKQIRKALLKVKGVDDVYIDMVTRKVAASGRWVDQKKALKAVKKTGRTAVLWPSTYSIESYNGYSNQQYSDYGNQQYNSRNNQQCYNHKRSKSHTEKRSMYAAQPHAYAAYVPSSSYNNIQPGYVYHDSNMYSGNQISQYMHEEDEMKLYSDYNSRICAIM